MLCRSLWFALLAYLPLVCMIDTVTEGTDLPFSVTGEMTTTGIYESGNDTEFGLLEESGVSSGDGDEDSPADDSTSTHEVFSTTATTHSTEITDTSDTTQATQVTTPEFVRTTQTHSQVNEASTTAGSIGEPAKEKGPLPALGGIFVAGCLVLVWVHSLKKKKQGKEMITSATNPVYGADSEVIPGMVPSTATRNTSCSEPDETQIVDNIGYTAWDQSATNNPDSGNISDRQLANNNNYYTIEPLENHYDADETVIVDNTKYGAWNQLSIANDNATNHMQPWNHGAAKHDGSVELSPGYSLAGPDVPILIENTEPDETDLVDNARYTPWTEPDANSEGDRNPALNDRTAAHTFLSSSEDTVMIDNTQYGKF